jgi:hypothetical protein
MGLFRRGKGDSSDAQEPDVSSDVVDSDAGADDDVAAAANVSGYVRSEQGPWDVAEQDRADGELPRLDLGSLLIPGMPGLSLQVEADQQTQAVMAVTAMKEDGAVQLQAFAAPRSEGIWDEFRTEIRSEIAAGPGQITEVDGPFGPELRAILPATAPDGRQAVQPVRFVGIDGPRWFLRAVFLGKAAVEPDFEDELHTLVRQTIVVRGPDAMAPRDLLPLRLPPQEGSPEEPQGEGDDDFDDEDGVDYDDLNPFERGPEITEIR